MRQSTQHQVRHHHQGRERQYELAERAKQLGFAKVIVIDEDHAYGRRETRSRIAMLPTCANPQPRIVEILAGPEWLLGLVWRSAVEVVAIKSPYIDIQLLGKILQCNQGNFSLVFRKSSFENEEFHESGECQFCLSCSILELFKLGVTQ